MLSSSFPPRSAELVQITDTDLDVLQYDVTSELADAIIGGLLLMHSCLVQVQAEAVHSLHPLHRGHQRNYR